jgi:hypothetical protein
VYNSLTDSGQLMYITAIREYMKCLISENDTFSSYLSTNYGPDKKALSSQLFLVVKLIVSFHFVFNRLGSSVVNVV